MMVNHDVCDELKDPKTENGVILTDHIVADPGVYHPKTENGVILTDCTVANPGVYDKVESLVLK